MAKIKELSDITENTPEIEKIFGCEIAQRKDNRRKRHEIEQLFLYADLAKWARNFLSRLSSANLIIFHVKVIKPL